MIIEAWCICGSNLEWHPNWPKLMQPWQKLCSFLQIYIIYEREFSRQNAIKSHLHNRLNSKILDALMWVSLCRLEVDSMDWAIIFGETCETKGYLPLIDNFFLTNQDWIILLKILVLKIFRGNPKLR